MPNKISHKKKMVPIAIVGVSALVPGATNVSQFWRNIVQKKDLIKDVPPTHWLIDDYYDPDPSQPDKTYCKRGAFLDAVDFDYREFGIPPNNLSATDSNQLLSLIVAKQVLHDATGGDLSSIDLSRVGVMLGITVAQELAMYISARLQKPILAKALRKHGISDELAQKICQSFGNSYVPWQENTFPGLLGNIVAGRIANRFNLGGTNCTIDAACASALGALALAANELALNKCDMIITGGADTLNDPFTFVCFSKTPALSTSGDCRPFSQDADGTILGEGLVFFAMRRLEDAERDGQRIYAVIRGIGSSSDGRSKSIYAPAAHGQSKAILAAYQAAGYSPNTVDLIEAHGTATKAGDIAEFAGLCQAFETAGDNRKNKCALGSVKSQIGHTKGAAGAISLLKAVMSLHHKVLPPTLKVDQVNPQLEIEKTPFYLNTETRPWIHGNSKHPRRAGVSSFGFGGSNFHITVEEYLGPSQKPLLLPSWTNELVVFSAETTEQLLATLEQVLAEIALHVDHTNDNHFYLHYIARKSQLEVSKKPLPIRLAMVAKSDEDLKQKLNESIHRIKTQTLTTLSLAAASALTGIYYSTVAEPQPKIAFLFPGQGSQYVNMSRDVTLAFAPMRNTWDEFAKLETAAKNAGSESASRRIDQYVFPNPVFADQDRLADDDQLTATEHAQPALSITNMAYFNLINALTIKPDYIAGHSFGEITALCAAGALNNADMFTIAKKRGEIMAKAGNNNEPGAMLAVVCAPDMLANLLSDWELKLSIANYNSPQQTILSGTEAVINQAHEKLKEQKIASKKIAVSGAFHSPWMEPYADEFLQFLTTTINFTPCQTPTYANVSGDLHDTHGDTMINALTQQLSQPVQFQKIIESMYQQGARIFVEVGPGHVLTKLTQQCLQDKPIVAIALDKKGENGVTQLWHGLAQLFMAGFNPDFSVIWSEYEEMPLPELSMRKPYTVKLTGTTYGKPYPSMYMNNSQEANEIADENEDEDKGEGDNYKNKEPGQFELSNTQPIEVNTIEIKTQFEKEIIPVDKKNHQQVEINNNEIHTNQMQYSKLQMFEKFQQQALEVQNTYQKIMLESHLSFLKTTENMLNTFVGMGSDLTDLQTIKTNDTIIKPNLLSNNVANTVVQKPVSKVAVKTSNETIDEQKMNQIENSLLAHYNGGSAVPVATYATPGPNLNVVAAAPEIDLSDETQLTTILLETIAEKTGYPVDMLNMDMSLEADLGIDSIKRVEILAGLQERMPSMPEAEPAMIGNLQTLNEIVKFIAQQANLHDLKKK